MPGQQHIHAQAQAQAQQQERQLPGCHLCQYTLGHPTQPICQQPPPNHPPPTHREAPAVGFRVGRVAKLPAGAAPHHHLLYQPRAQVQQELVAEGAAPGRQAGRQGVFVFGGGMLPVQRPVSDAVKVGRDMGSPAPLSPFVSSKHSLAPQQRRSRVWQTKGALSCSHRMKSK
jgi:hypothetical protein